MRKRIRAPERLADCGQAATMTGEQDVAPPTTSTEEYDRA
jgi:hypothetical protein